MFVRRDNVSIIICEIEMRCDSVRRQPPTIGVIIDLQARIGDPVAPNHTPFSLHSFTSLLCAA